MHPGSSTVPALELQEIRWRRRRRKRREKKTAERRLRKEHKESTSFQSRSAPHAPLEPGERDQAQDRGSQWGGQISSAPQTRGRAAGAGWLGREQRAALWFDGWNLDCSTVGPSGGLRDSSYHGVYAGEDLGNSLTLDQRFPAVTLGGAQLQLVTSPWPVIGSLLFLGASLPITPNPQQWAWPEEMPRLLPRKARARC